MVTESQKKAQSKYNEKNKEKINYIKNKSAARNFILKKATEEDLLELKKLIDERLNENVK